MSSTNSGFAFQAKIYNESFAFKSSLWKLQKWLNQFRAKSVSLSPSSATSNNNNYKKRQKQENENNFRSIIEELQTMLSSHKRKYKIKRVRKKPTKCYALSRELRNIGENLNLSIDDEIDENGGITKVIFGSNHDLSQFCLEIAFKNKTCDVMLNECDIGITLCLNENIMADIQFDEIDIKTMKIDLETIINDGDFDKLTNKLLLIRYFDDFHNYFPSLLLNKLIENGDGKGSIHKQIEFCLKYLPNIIEYKRLLDGPSIVYAQQIMDCILTKIKPPKQWKLSFIGLYPAKCILNEPILNDLNDTVTIKPIIADDDNDDDKKDENENKQHLLYWFVLRPSIIVPIEIAKKIFNQCLGEIGYRFNKKTVDDDELILDDDKIDKRSSHSSWIIDQTYCYHNMLIGDIDLKYTKQIEIFKNEYQYFKFKNTHFNGNGVKIDQIPIYNLNYLNKENIHKTTLFKIINELKNWVIINQLYSQCFDYNYKKWKIKNNGAGKIEKISNRFEITIRNSNHLELIHLANKSDNNQNDDNKSNKTMDIDDNDDNILNDEQYEQYRKQYKLPPNVDEWIANFYIDNHHNITVNVKYWVLIETNIENKPQSLEIDTIYDKKIGDIFHKTNSVPITLSYISKLFDARYLKQKLKMETLKKHQQEIDDHDNDDNMIDID